MSVAWERRAGSLVVLVGSILLASGCGKPSPESGDKKAGNVSVKGADDSKPKTTPDPHSGANADKTHPGVFCGDFIQALFAEKVVPAQFTPAFLKSVARPEPKSDEQQKLGYNPDKLQEFLKTMRGGGVAPSLIPAESADGPFLYGVSKPDNGKEEGWLIRLAKSPNAPGWQIDWLQRSTAKGPGWIENNPGPELIGAQLVAHEFLENLLGGDLTLAEAVMSNAMKRDWAYSSADSYKDQGYDSAFLHNLRLTPLKNGFTDFTIASRIQRDVNGKPVMLFSGELRGVAKKSESKRYELVIAKTKEGSWLVDDFKLQ